MINIALAAQTRTSIEWGRQFCLRTRFPAGPAAWKGGCGHDWPHHNNKASVPRHLHHRGKTRKCLWGQSFRFAAGLLPGVGMVQDF